MRAEAHRSCVRSNDGIRAERESALEKFDFLLGNLCDKRDEIVRIMYWREEPVSSSLPGYTGIVVAVTQTSSYDCLLFWRRARRRVWAACLLRMVDVQGSLD